MKCKAILFSEVEWDIFRFFIAVLLQLHDSSWLSPPYRPKYFSCVSVPGSFSSFPTFRMSISSDFLTLDLKASMTVLFIYLIHKGLRKLKNVYFNEIEGGYIIWEIKSDYAINWRKEIQKLKICLLRWTLASNICFCRTWPWMCSSILTFGSTTEIHNFDSLIGIHRWKISIFVLIKLNCCVIFWTWVLLVKLYIAG